MLKIHFVSIVLGNLVGRGYSTGDIDSYKGPFPLFEGCSCKVNDDDTKLVISNCEGEQSSLTLTKDANGEVMVDDIFRDPLTGIIKQKHIRFEGNEALEMINWEVFNLHFPQAPHINLKEVVFGTFNPRLQLQVRPIDDMITIDRVSILYHDSVQSVNLERAKGIHEIAFYADFVNDTEYVNKVSYGYNPSTVVKGVAVVGDPGRSYRLAEFMNTLLNAMVSKATLLSFRLSNLVLLGPEMDISDLLSGAYNLKSLTIDNCTYDKIVNAHFMKKILGYNFKEECNETEDLPMDDVTLNFFRPHHVIVEKGAFGERCPQSKAFGGSMMGESMVRAWGQNGTARCEVNPYEKNSNHHDAVCAMCRINSRNGTAEMANPDCIDYDIKNRMDSGSIAVKAIQEIVKLYLLFMLASVICYNN